MSNLNLPKTRLLLIITKSEFGGAQKHVYYLATRLPRDRYEVSVACGTGGLLIPKLREAGIEVIPIPNLVREINPIRDFLALLDLFRLIRRKRPHIVHTNSTKAGFLGRLAAKLAGVPVIIFTAHGFVLNEPLGLLKRLLFYAVERIGGMLSDLIIAVSEADRQLAINFKIINPNRIITIHNGLDISYSTIEQKSKAVLGLQDDHRIIGTVANFYPTKGLPFFIQAIPYVRDVFPETNFVIVGDGRQRSELERLTTELGLDSCLFFLGQRDDVSQILPLFDVFVLPSVKEGLPYALLEAMAAARPVVATAVGGVPEVIMDGQTGLLVPPKDPEALAQAIITFLRNPERARAMGEAGRKRVLEHFTVERMVAETERVYQELLAQKGLK
jgi:glycosyltransferase involved in cell wall biosynthesis